MKLETMIKAAPVVLLACGDKETSDTGASTTSSECSTQWYADADGDGFGDVSDYVFACDQPTGYVVDNTDCDDANSAINPATLWFADADMDGFGSMGSSYAGCEQPSGFVTDNTDCDDGDTLVNPSATEVCDTIDNNCNSLTDDDDPTLDLSTTTTFYQDNDGDGYGGAAVQACSIGLGIVSDNTDCDDNEPLANPSLEEICNDGIDNDCDGTPNECHFDRENTIDLADTVIHGAHYNVYFAPQSGDLNGDSVSDILIQGIRSIHIIYGPQTGIGNVEDVADITITNDTVEPTISNLTTTGVRGTADFNGDNYSDFIVMGIYDEYNKPYFVHGPITADTNISSLIDYSTDSYTSIIGDLDADGISDLTIVDYDTDMILISGNQSDDFNETDAFANIIDDIGYQYRGISTIENTRDYNGDGIDDILISALNHNTGYLGDEAIYVIHGPITDTYLSDSDTILHKPTSTAYNWFSSTSYNSIFCDLDGDGRNEIITEGNDGTGSHETDYVFVINDRSSFNLNTSYASMYINDDSTARIRQVQISCLNDIDNNGNQELAVGRNQISNFNENDGNLAILTPTTISGTHYLSDADININGNERYMGIGIDTRTIGDFSGDGIEDFAVLGYPTIGGNFIPSTYIFNGRSGF